MVGFQLLSVLALPLAATAMGNGPSENMGPAAFMWPPDRVWSGDTDNTPPCGSAAGVTNRTAFPISGGKVAFTAQDDSYHAELSISFNNDPKSQTDFTPLRTAPIPELDPGHTCLYLPAQPSSQQFVAGTNATIQIKYVADFDRPENQTFYACADITFVPAASFNGANVPCFNATDPTDVPAPTRTGTPTGLPGHGETGPPLSTPGPAETQIVEGGGGLSKGGIAGVVVGCVVGVALLVGLGLLWYRERERKRRLVRERDGGRGVKWVDGSVGGAEGSVGGDSIRLGNVESRG